MDNCRQNGVFTFVSLTRTSDGAYAIRPYPFGRKIETVETYGFKKQSCAIDRQGKGAKAYAPRTGTIVPGRLPLGNCWRNWVRALVPLTGTSDGAYAFVSYPFGRKIGTVKTYEFKK